MAKKKPKYEKPGQPSSYNPDFHPQDFISKAKQGYLVTQIASSWDLHRDTLYEWCNKHKEFSDAFKLGRQHAETWWMNLGRAAMTGGAMINGQKVKIDNTMFCYLTKATLGWRDTSFITEDDKVSSVEIKVTKYDGQKNNS